MRIFHKDVLIHEGDKDFTIVTHNDDDSFMIRNKFGKDYELHINLPAFKVNPQVKPVNTQGQIMKNTFEAVDEFEAVWPVGGVLVLSDWGLLQRSHQLFCLEYISQHVCTREEFNALVAEMETNFGTSATYDEHRWEYTPSINTINDQHNILKEIIDFDADIPKEFDRSVGGTIKPKFTQEQSDNGELPCVGAEVTFIDEASKTLVECEILMYHKLSVFIFIDGWDGGTAISSTTKFKPLTPPIVLIDGCAYQFNADGILWNGLYSKQKDLFILSNGTVPPKGCTNIVKLVPEVKS